MSVFRKLLQWLRHRLRPDTKPDFSDIGLPDHRERHIGEHPPTTQDIHWNLPARHRDEQYRRPRGKRGR